MREVSLPESIVTIDCHYVLPRKTAAYLIVEGERAAFVDNNTVFAVPHLMAALEARGLAPEQVEYAIITHVHLDHAGGSAELLKRCPNATLLAHPKAARHIIDPSRLIQGARQIYEGDSFDRLYGVIEPAPAERVRAMDDGEVLRWGTRDLRFLYTRGHASHHCCIHDSGTNSIFTGDSFGIGRSEYEREGPSFVVCSCTPSEFDAAEALLSVDRIVDTGAERAYIGHYGAIPNPAAHADALRRSITQMEAIAAEAAAMEAPDSEVLAHCIRGVRAAGEEAVRRAGCPHAEEDLAWLETEVVLNAMGLQAVSKLDENVPLKTL